MVIRIKRDLNAVRGFIREGIEKGKSANKMLEELREKGLGIRRATFLSMVREEKKQESLERAGLAVKYVRDDRIPTERVITKTTMNLKSRYLVVGRVIVRKIDGNRIQNWVSFNTNFLNTAGSMKSRLKSVYYKGVTTHPEDYDVEVDEIEEIESIVVERIYERRSILEELIGEEI